MSKEALASFNSILRITVSSGEWFEMIVDGWYISQLHDLSWVRSYRGIISNASQAYARVKGTSTNIRFPSDDYVVICVAL